MMVQTSFFFYLFGELYVHDINIDYNKPKISDTYISKKYSKK